MQNSDRRLASNRSPIIKPCHIHLYLKSMSTVFEILKSASNYPIMNIWSFLTFSNQRPIMSLVYALTNKSFIDPRIWKDVDLRIPLNRSVI